MQKQVHISLRKQFHTTSPMKVSKIKSILIKFSEKNRVRVLKSSQSSKNQRSRQDISNTDTSLRIRTKENSNKNIKFTLTYGGHFKFIKRLFYCN